MEPELSILCTNSVKNKLDGLGIRDVKGLLSYNGKTYANITALKKKCIQHYNVPIEIRNHTWKDCIAHCVDSNGKIIRCKIESLYVLWSTILLKLSFITSSRRNTQFKMVSPTELLLIRSLWAHCDVVSDNESETEEYNDDTDNLQIGILPLFDVNFNDLPDLLSYVDGVRRLRSEVNNIRNIQKIKQQ